MRNLSSYIMFFGIFVVAFSGNWIILNYDKVSIYPKSSTITFGIGLIVVVCGFIVSKLSTYREDEHALQKDYRDSLNKWLQANGPSNKWFTGIILIPLVISAFYSWDLLFVLLKVYLFLGIVLAGFVYLLKEDRLEAVDFEFKGKTKKLMNLIDYRKHPFNISLIIYILVIVSFVLSKQWEIPFYMETSGNARYAASLPMLSFLMSSLMVISTFIYIIHNGDLFGFRKSELSTEKIMFVHFAEVFCGLILITLIFTVIYALYSL
ncbi:nucleotidyltransferase [Solibacillus merdavium]|uniref:Nucleotidyltransferase n=1 Tax=Solibacillus merdavium TaxID=2762218 RepID=A0ABR8XMM7_9BACL|nr:nucleotidyltransferase [Solibacillus merdavium]MBD8033174.1 nucleotidyltransferase [Solibacillus merdavium]